MNRMAPIYISDITAGKAIRCRLEPPQQFPLYYFSQDWRGYQLSAAAGCVPLKFFFGSTDSSARATRARSAAPAHVAGLMPPGKVIAQAEFFGGSLGLLQEPASPASSIIIRRKTRLSIRENAFSNSWISRGLAKHSRGGVFSHRFQR
jgi:hypothetical protein